MRWFSHRALRLGGAFLALLLPLSVVGCGGGGSSSPPTQTVRGIVLLDTGMGAADGDPLAGLVDTSVRVFSYTDPGDPVAFDSIPHPKTDANGQFIIKPYRGGSFSYLYIPNRCSTSASVYVRSNGDVLTEAAPYYNYHGASEELKQRATGAFAALQASAAPDKLDILILVSDQADTCRS